MPRWLAYSLVAIALWGVWGVLNTPASNALSPLPLQVLSTLGLVPVAALLLFSKNLRQGRNHGRGFAYAFATGLCGSLGNVSLSASLTHGGEASIVLPLASVYPIVTVVLAAVLLRERLNLVQMLGFLLALATLFLAGLISAGEPQPGAEGKSWWQKALSPWMAYATGTLVLFGLAAIFQKLSTNNISNELSMVGFASAFVVIAAAIVLSSREFAWSVGGKAWGLALAYGALIGVGTLTLFAAYRWGKAAVVTAVTALYPALTVVLAVPFLGDRLSALKVTMIVLALAAGVALTYEGKPAPAPEAAPS